MSKVTRSETRTVTRNLCDLCEKDCSNGFANTCSICRRECCLTCCRWVPMYSDRDKRLLDFSLHVCHKCESFEDKLHFAERITAIADGADLKIHELLTQWKALAKS